jgi:hypothetical protein
LVSSNLTQNYNNYSNHANQMKSAIENIEEEMQRVDTARSNEIISFTNSFQEELGELNKLVESLINVNQSFAAQLANESSARQASESAVRFLWNEVKELSLQAQSNSKLIEAQSALIKSLEQKQHESQLNLTQHFQSHFNQFSLQLLKHIAEINNRPISFQPHINLSSPKTSNANESTSNSITTTKKPSMPSEITKRAADSLQDNKSLTATYCLCNSPYSASEYMISCDYCNRFYHPACVNLTEAAAKSVGKFICPKCEPARLAAAESLNSDLGVADKNSDELEEQQVEAVERKVETDERRSNNEKQQGSTTKLDKFSLNLVDGGSSNPIALVKVNKREEIKEDVAASPHPDSRNNSREKSSVIAARVTFKVPTAKPTNNSTAPNRTQSSSTTEKAAAAGTAEIVQLPRKSSLGAAGPSTPRSSIITPAAASSTNTAAGLIFPAVDYDGSWRSHTSSDGRVYYFHNETRQTTWIKPIILTEAQIKLAKLNPWISVHTDEGDQFFYNYQTKENRLEKPEIILLEEDEELAINSDEEIASDDEGDVAALLNSSAPANSLPNTTKPSAQSLVRGLIRGGGKLATVAEEH